MLATRSMCRSAVDPSSPAREVLWRPPHCPTGFDSAAVTSGGADSLRVQYVKMEVGNQGYASARNELCNDTLPAMTRVGFVFAGATMLSERGRIVHHSADDVLRHCGLSRSHVGHNGRRANPHSSHAAREPVSEQPPLGAGQKYSDAYFVSPEATLPAPPVPADEWPPHLTAANLLKSSRREGTRR